MFSSRSSLEKPRPLVSRSRTSSPSRTSTGQPRCSKLSLQQAGQGALARAGQAREPDDESLSHTRLHVLTASLATGDSRGPSELGARGGARP